MAKRLLLVVFLFPFITGNAQDIFHWKWQLVQQQLRVTGRLDGREENEILTEINTAKKRFDRLYHIIDEIEYPKMKEYLKTVDTLSNQLVLPFARQIKQCRRVIIEIDSSLLNFPIEFLKINNRAVAVSKPLLFTINGYAVAEDTGSVTLHKGFIVRDSTSDPEKACLTTLYKYPASNFKSAFKITEKDLGIKPGIDFILISAHGDASGNNFRGGVALNKIDNVSPAFFAVNDPKLVYIDACDQGINWNYIEALAATAKINFYTGPIISNDSGESSTRTINWFFDYLKQSGDPVMAMWKTRIKLYNYYNKNIHAMDVINKSFIFRMYKL